VYLLGKKYLGTPANIVATNKKIEEHFKSVIWITYRSGFPYLLKGSDKNK
jgi:hypothetical protein